jgi:type I restriction enzyme, S subunit
MTFATRTLGEICDEVGGIIRTGPFGSQLHESDYREEGTPVIMPKDIVEGKVSAESIARIGEQDVARLSQHALKRGEIVYGRRGDIGRRALITERETGWLCGTGCLRVSLGETVLDPQFLFYYLGQPRVIEAIAKQAVGATLPNLNTSIIRSIAVTYPPLPTQRRIASILSAYDDLIENDTRRLRILEQMAQAIYREWFVEFRAPGVKLRKATPEEQKVTGKNRFPVGWELRQLGDVSTIFRGKSYRSTELVDEGGLPFLNLKCIERGGGFRYDGVKRFQGEYKETHTAKTGDLVVAVTDMTQERRLVAHAARVHILDNDFAVMSMDLVRIEPKADIGKDYLHGMLRFSEFPKEVSQHANGANVLHLNPVQIQSFRFTLPPSVLRDRYAEVASNLYKQCDVLQTKNANLRQTRDLLLPRLVGGEIAVVA